MRGEDVPGVVAEAEAPGAAEDDGDVVDDDDDAGAGLAARTRDEVQNGMKEA
jgi:hypothetical protein